jgi:hypothetical protein
MNDQNNPQHSSRRFVKGVHRASFSPVDADSQYVPPPPPVPTPVPAPVPVTRPPAVTMDVAPVVAPKKKTPFAKIFFFFILALGITVASAYSFYMYWNSQKQLNALRVASPEKYTQLQDQSLVDKVRRHMDIPDETPLINTVDDANSLRSQLFYAKAEDGDKVLVFSQRAILYRPSEDKVIEVGFIRPVSPTPVAGGEASGSAVVAGAATSSGRILLKNEKK